MREGVGVVWLARARGGPGPDLLSPTVVRADLPPLTALLALLAFLTAVLFVLRLVLTRRSLRSRVQVELRPADTFDPSPDAIRRFASQLARTRRGFFLGWLERPASAVRILVAPDTQGVVHYRLEVPERARPALLAALSAYSQIDVRECEPVALPSEGRTVRVELTLARALEHPLGDPGLDPDPLQGLAGVLGRIHGAGEGALVAVDLLPPDTRAESAATQTAVQGGRPLCRDADRERA